MNNSIKYCLSFIILFSTIETAFSQVKSFTKNSDLIKAQKGDTILIHTDSAYILSGNRADYLNDKLDELDTIKSMYNDQSNNRKELIDKIDELNQLVIKFRSEYIKDSLIISQNLSEVINELNTVSVDLRQNNETLKANTVELQKRVETLEELITQLKKEMRGIWWNGISDKILAYTAGIATGIILVLLL